MARSSKRDNIVRQEGVHAYGDVVRSAEIAANATRFSYAFENFFHPLVGDLLAEHNRRPVAGVLDPDFLRSVSQPPRPAPQERDFFAYFGDAYQPGPNSDRHTIVELQGEPKTFDLRSSGPYADYNWELCFHLPVAIAVHLGKNQRFAEAQRWFHYVFDPTTTDTSVDVPERYWRFLGFRGPHGGGRIADIIAALSDPNVDARVREEVLNGYREIMAHPFEPHRVARTRVVAYQYYVFMKYMDNLIAWGDSLFRQDTIESINEATQRYVLASNLLGRRPERISPPGRSRARTFAQLRGRLDAMSNAMVAFEAEFPYNLVPPDPEPVEPGAAAALFGIGRSLYFCVPANEKLLGYWDLVESRLYQIRHCMNIDGVVRQLALFEPPIDPGLLVKARAAGLDLGSVVAGLHQAPGPLRAPFMIQKALELAAEVRSMGASLLSAIEKADSERLALLRQGQESKMQRLVQDARFLQWKQAESSTESLLRGRQAALERYRSCLRLLGESPDDQLVPETLQPNRVELTEANFDETYAALVGQYERAISLKSMTQLALVDSGSPTADATASSGGKLYLNKSEDADLNVLRPQARDEQLAAGVSDAIFGVLAMLPTFEVKAAYWGIGGGMKVAGGDLFAGVGRILSGALNTAAAYANSQAGSAATKAGYERRADEWTLQANLAAHELMQTGRQLIGSLLAEQTARREYLNAKKQVEHSDEVGDFLQDKFTSEELYNWMQGECSRLYFEYYRLAYDTCRKAEELMRRELMRPEVDAVEYIKFSYGDAGRKRLLAGEALVLDCRRMELAYHEANKRELEITKDVSLRQLDPLALLALRTTGSCEVTLPEWLFDLDWPGHYMRRLKLVTLSLPAIAGPHISVNCRLTLLGSSVRREPTLLDGTYERQGSDDPRFVDYLGASETIVTSRGVDDSGMFEPSTQDPRPLPFEFAGAQSRWRLELIGAPQFDRSTITDAVLRIRYTARDGGGVLGAAADMRATEVLAMQAPAVLALPLDLKADFPDPWYRFRSGEGDFVAELPRAHFAYMAQSRAITVTAVDLVQGTQRVRLDAGVERITAELADSGVATITIAGATIDRSAAVAPWMVLTYAIA